MKKRILIVDDERWFTNLLKYSLETEGYYDVWQENDPRHAVTAARGFAPDLVLMDLMMPHVDGSEVAAGFKDDVLLRDLPVIFLTALVTEDDTPVGAWASGGQTFLPKSVSIERLIECIEEKIDQPAACAAS
jgi:DNA-binding response OmpR family regulator